MSKTITTELKTHLASEVTTVCTCWQVNRRDGNSLYFTDLDQDIEVDGNVYVSAVGYNRSAMTMNSDFSVDNIQIAGIIDDDSLTEADLRAGKYDGAELRMFLINYMDLTMGSLRLRRGTLGDVSSTPSGMFQTQMNGMGQILAHVIGDIFTGTCRVDLGSTECTIDLTAPGGFLWPATVVAVTDAAHFRLTVAEPRAVSGWFDGGLITWVTGNNSGRSIEIKTWDNPLGVGNTTTFLPMSQPVQVGDTLNIYPGCNKLAKTCRDKFNNIINNRSFPFIPGIDTILASPPTLR